MYASLAFVTWNMLTRKPVFSPQVGKMQFAGSAWPQSLGGSWGIRTASCHSHTSQSLLGPEEKPKSATVGGCRQLGPTEGFSMETWRDHFRWLRLQLPPCGWTEHWDHFCLCCDFFFFLKWESGITFLYKVVLNSWNLSDPAALVSSVTGETGHHQAGHHFSVFQLCRADCCCPALEDVQGWSLVLPVLTFISAFAVSHARILSLTALHYQDICFLIVFNSDINKILPPLLMYYLFYLLSNLFLTFL